MTEPASVERGPASAELEREIASELRRKGIVLWLDLGAHYTGFADRLAQRHAEGSFPHPVVGFRGSFLELMFALEPYGNELDNRPLLVHLPGHNEQSIRETPLLELYECGTRFRKAVDTLVRDAASGRVAPAEVERFLAQKPTLEEADAWLASAAAESSLGLAALLEELGPRLLAEALVDPAALAPRAQAPEELAVLRRYVHRLTGLDEAWAAIFAPEAGRELEATVRALGAWVLAVEYVHDLKRPPHDDRLARLAALSAPLVKACRELASGLRDTGPEAYELLADEVEGLLAEELAAMSPDDLGQIDTFREEESRVLRGAVEALRLGQWEKARAWWEARRGDRSFWLRRDPARRWAWSLVGEAADFGATLAAHNRPLAGAKSLDEAVDRYAAGAYLVDRAHRRFEQLRASRLDSRLPHYGELREVALALRSAHRAWADELARDFASLCTGQGFLPSSDKRQRNLFEQVVLPLVHAGGKVAVFVVDALRFEMASELAEALARPHARPRLEARLAELPTITSVGMNVLAPVADAEQLKVAGVFQGFSTGEFTVRRPEDRARAMGQRAVGRAALSLDLAEVCEARTAALEKKLAAHSLVVVHSKEIDDAGEANLGLSTFEATLQQLQAAWHHLQLAGVKSFVFTADHGFLLQDETTHQQDYGTKRDPQRRHVYDEHPRKEKGMVNVSLSSLGYGGLGGYLLFREDTAVFKTAAGAGGFAHGGNSLQERVIPVLVLQQERAEQAGFAAYEVEAEPLPPALGVHRLRARVVFAKDTSASLGFASARTVDLALRAPEGVHVVLRDVVGPAKLRSGRIQIEVGQAWAELYFALEGPNDDRAQVELHHPDGLEKVRGLTLEPWYAVRGTSPKAPRKPSVPAPGSVPPGAPQKPSAPTGSPAKPSAPPQAAPPQGSSQKASTPPPSQRASEEWSARIDDEGVRRVFVHLGLHGSITEGELTVMLGSARAVRRFSLDLESYLPRLPFRVRIEPAEGGKRYVREVE